MNTCSTSYSVGCACRHTPHITRPRGFKTAARISRQRLFDGCVKAAAVADTLLIPPPVSENLPSLSSNVPSHHEQSGEVAQAWEAFRATLHEYRSIREQLRPWFTVFLEVHGRTPNSEDVRSANLPRVQKLYHKYNILRQKLFNDIPLLRQTIRSDDSVPLPSTSAHTGLTPINANGPTVQEQLALSSRMSRVVNFRESVTDASSAASTSATVDSLRIGSNNTGTSALTPDTSTSASIPDEGEDLSADASQSSARVKTAFLAALKYKKKKTQPADTAGQASSATHSDSLLLSKFSVRRLKPGESPAVQYGQFPKNETRRARYIDDDGDAVQPLLCP